MTMYKNYLQISKGVCAGNKNLFDKIRKILSKDKNLEINDNGMVFTIIDKTPEIKPVIVHGHIKEVVSNPEQELDNLVSEIKNKEPSEE